MTLYNIKFLIMRNLTITESKLCIYFNKSRNCNSSLMELFCVLRLYIESSSLFGSFRPMRPRLYHRVKTIPWTSGWPGLSMSKKLVVTLYFAIIDSMSDQFSHCLYRSRLWCSVAVISNDANPNALAVERYGMGTLFAPTTAFVNFPVLADYKIVADIGPSFIVHMLFLDSFDFQLTLSLALATRTSRMMNDYVGHWFDLEIDNW